MGRADDALARRAAREARRAAMQARNGRDADADTSADDERDAGTDPIRAAREAATAAAVGAAVGAVRALTSRRGDEEEEGLEPSTAEADAQPAEDEDVGEGEDDQTRQEQPRQRRSPSRRREGTRLGDVDRAVHAAREQLRQLHGDDAESVSGFERLDDGWRVTLEVVELRRIPETTDVMASYAVDVDRNGDLVTYERVRRYQRSETLDGSAP